MYHKEVEFKYSADDISLNDFTAFCKAKGEHNFIAVAGYDYFYHNNKDKDNFGRHRVGPNFNQLTFKWKTSDKNNYIRTEHNITLDPTVNPENVKGLLSELGYSFNTTIYKNAFVYAFDRYTMAYYVCYDAGLVELGRFVEIEMSEEHPWNSEEEAWDALVELEQEAKVLGVSARRRIKNSLFEQFRKP